MTLYYRTHSWSSQPQVTEETIKLWKHLSEKSNWRIVQLPNGFLSNRIPGPKQQGHLD